jgi:hypothetical protein
MTLRDALLATYVALTVVGDVVVIRLLVGLARISREMKREAKEQRDRRTE